MYLDFSVTYYSPLNNATMILEGLSIATICFLGYRLGILAGLIANETDAEKKKRLEEEFHETNRQLNERALPKPKK